MSAALERVHELLETRVAQAAAGKLVWLEPVRTGRNDEGHQLAAGTDYVIRKTFMRDGTPMYWAWHARNLLGYGDRERCKSLCEAHHERERACR